jgi:hypothetical protein
MADIQCGDVQDVGGSPSLFGLASIVNHISEVIAYFYSFQLINKHGHIKVLYLGLFGNFLRFLCFSLIPSAWLVLPIELMQGKRSRCLDVVNTNRINACNCLVGSIDVHFNCGTTRAESRRATHVEFVTSRNRSGCRGYIWRNDGVVYW